MSWLKPRLGEQARPTKIFSCSDRVRKAAALEPASRPLDCRAGKEVKRAGGTPALRKARPRLAVPTARRSLHARKLNQKQDAGLKPGATKGESGPRDALRLRSYAKPGGAKTACYVKEAAATTYQFCSSILRLRLERPRVGRSRCGLRGWWCHRRCRLCVRVRGEGGA
jgi:hypothetical protein